jgi:hypothetical protein
MEIITYKGIEYPTRTFDAYLASEDEDDVQTITVASSELSDALGDRIEVTDSEEEGIDNSIYFYVDADNFYLRADVVCYLHLDEPFVLVAEHKSI